VDPKRLALGKGGPENILQGEVLIQYRGKKAKRFLMNTDQSFYHYKRIEGHEK